MAITVMATVEKINKVAKKPALLAACFILSPTTLAGEWTFVPSLGFTETFSDNVELTKQEQTSSFVSQLIFGFDANFQSKDALISFSGTETLAAYSHNSDLNDDFQTMQLEGLFSLWSSGPQLIISSDISNVSQSNSNNSLADLVSGDTVQRQIHSAGLQYNIQNSHHILDSSIIYSVTESEDNIGDSNGYTAILNSKNGNAARAIFWQITGNFSNLKNNSLQGENYSLESKLGAITSWRLNPFVRYYNERITGNIPATNPDTTPSWGPGVQWLATKNFTLDVSYNYVQEGNDNSDDYLAANVDWQPSARTSLKAGYNQRFFGDSYNFELTHQTKRLKNLIYYTETIEIFDRYSYQEEKSGDFWCLSPVSQDTASSDCLSAAQPPSDTTNYQLVAFNNLVPVENNEFTLNKRLLWTSTLNLSRTSFKFTASTREREALSTHIIDDYITADFKISRKTSARSALDFLVSYSENTFDKNNPNGSRQKDIYKSISTTYSRELASSLSAFFTLRFLDRESSVIDRTYNEVRASINITKDF